MERPSIRSIARLAGCSPSTVSLALNNAPRIPKSTRESIQRLAKSQGYRPNGKVHELMAEVRRTRDTGIRAAVGVVSLYDDANVHYKLKHLSQFLKGSQLELEDSGYGMKFFWLKDPRMSMERIRKIMDSRGIDGVICLGSSRLEDEFPPELSHKAIVTNGISISTSLHRVRANFFGDMLNLLNETHNRGYRKPLLIIDAENDSRSNYEFSAAYLLFRERRISRGKRMSIQPSEKALSTGFIKWVTKHKPDLLIIQGSPETFFKIEELLKKSGIRVPDDVGIAQASTVSISGISGITEDHFLMGKRAVQLLIGRLLQRDVGIPHIPFVDLVNGTWEEGNSLRPGPRVFQSAKGSKSIFGAM